MQYYTGKVTVFCSESYRVSVRKEPFLYEEPTETHRGTYRVFKTKPPKLRNTPFSTLFEAQRRSKGK